MLAVPKSTVILGNHAVTLGNHVAPTPLPALPTWGVFVCGGAAASVAEFATLPIDTAKVRLQLARNSKEGMFGTMRRIVTEEGTRGLFKGLAPAIQRQLVFASLRIGLYAEITERLKTPGETNISLGRKIIAGLLSGAIGITVANVSY
jgi:solute carrier family 25 uncoupling protein 8/9